MDWLPRRARRGAGSGPSDPSDHVVTLITRAGCHLCETAEGDLRRLAAELGFVLTVRDLAADPSDTPAGLDAEQVGRWADLVPVVLVDGREHAFWRVDDDRLRAALGA